MDKKKGGALFISNSLEHMLFPVPPKLTLQAILVMLPALSYEPALTLDKYKAIAKKGCGQELEGLWWIAKTEADKDRDRVEPKLLGVLLFLQLVNSKLEGRDSGFN
jgi:hypothetical protein